MSRSRVIFFAIIGATLLLVVGLLVILPSLGVCVGTQTAACSANATSVALTSVSVSGNVAATATVQSARANTVTLRVMYGSEKEAWFKAAIAQFQAANPNIIIDAAPEGSVSAYDKLSHLQATDTKLKGDPIPVLWTPASQLEVNFLNAQNTFGKDLAVQCKLLVISPLVIISWSERSKVFNEYYKDKGGITLANLADALDPNGKIKGKWANLTTDPKAQQWGLINFGHTDPFQSNSGLMTLVLMANNYFQQQNGVSTSQVTDDKFDSWMTILEKANMAESNAFAASGTGNLMTDFIRKGPAQYDFIIAYESLAIDNYQNAIQTATQGLTITYPAFDIQSDHPLCLIDHPSITPAQHDAALKFQDFLLTPAIQKLALTFGFRPSDITIPLSGASTKFDDPALIAAGLGADRANGGTVKIVQTASGDSLIQLRNTWKRIIGS
jgi:Ca-activated chloride channel family protein